MANKIYIQFLNTGEDEDFGITFGNPLPTLITAPLLEDITLDIKSEFTSFADAIPALSDLVSMMGHIQTGMSGEMSAGWANLQNLFDVPRWQKTNPIRFVVKIGVYTKNDPKKNVWDVFTQFSRYSILSLTPDGKWRVPGISLSSMKDTQLNLAKGKSAKQVFSSNAKTIAVAVPGIIYLAPAMIESAIPTFSKQITESGYPLWANIEVSIVGLFPANTQIFKDVESFATGRFNMIKGKSITQIYSEVSKSPSVL